MSRLFVSQELLDQWSGEGKVELEGNTLKLVAEGRALEIQPGVRFVKAAAGEDRERLTGKVKTEQQMSALGAELYMSSVLIGEDAYDVQSGFLCEVPNGAAQAIGAHAVSRPPAAALGAPRGPNGPSGLPPKASPSANPKSSDERTLLAQFLLENLS